MSTSCQSCGMTIETGPYCRHCVDAEGKLQAFEERLERMTQFIADREPGLERERAEKRALEQMATLPAWRSHPRVVDRSRT